jgi:hypothetical protein
MLTQEKFAKLAKQYESEIRGMSLLAYNKFWNCDIHPQEVKKNYLSFYKMRHKLFVPHYETHHTFLTFHDAQNVPPYFLIKRKVEIKKTSLGNLCRKFKLTKPDLLRMLVNSKLIGLYNENTEIVFGLS